MNVTGSQTSYIIIIAVAVLVVLAFARLLVRRRRGARFDTAKFAARWQEVQSLCASENTWPLAIINGDKLLDDALKKARYKGKTMGERLVAAQRELSDNDGVWFGHKLRNKLVHDEFGKLRKNQVKKVLVSFRQALRDLGALQ